jgi:SpoIID/LytB domain protein
VILGLAATQGLLPEASAAGTSDVVVVGHGYGHARGMGQWGAYGYAVDQGWRSERILDHYYVGTKSGSVRSSSVTVRLTSMGTAIGGWVTSEQDFEVGIKLVKRGSSARIVAVPGGWRVYTSINGCRGGNDINTGIQSNAGILSAAMRIHTMADPGQDVTKLLTLCSSGRKYRGDLLAGMDRAGATYLANVLPTDSYLRSVVPRESFASWGDARGGLGTEALKAQAVAARSYALADRRWSDNRNPPLANTCDTTQCQSYPGAWDATSHVRVEDSRTDRAVAGTTGQVRVNATGAVVSTEFSTSTGGWTVAGVVDQGDSRAPQHTWTTRLDGTAIAKRYQVGTFSRLRVVGQNGIGDGGGRVLQVRVEGSAGVKDIKGEAFRSAFGLKSDYFFFVDQPRPQVTSRAFVKLAYSDKVYRQYGYSPNGWMDHGYVSATDYAASGRPQTTRLSSSYVKYNWSPTVYAVTRWPRESGGQTDQLTDAMLRKAGSPTPKRVDFIYGTLYYKLGNKPAIYAQAPDDSVHILTSAQWKAAGAPTPDSR